MYRLKRQELQSLYGKKKFASLVCISFFAWLFMKKLDVLCISSRISLICVQADINARSKHLCWAPVAGGRWEWEEPGLWAPLVWKMILVTLGKWLHLSFLVSPRAWEHRMECCTQSTQLWPQHTAVFYRVLSDTAKLLCKNLLLRWSLTSNL